MSALPIPSEDPLDPHTLVETVFDTPPPNRGDTPDPMRVDLTTDPSRHATALRLALHHDPFQSAAPRQPATETHPLNVHRARSAPAAPVAPVAEIAPATVSAAAPAATPSRRVSPDRPHGGRIAAGAVAVTLATVFVGATSYAALAAVFPWLSPVRSQANSVAAIDAPQTQIRTLDAAGPSDAERAISAIMASADSDFEDSLDGWTEIPSSTSVATPSLGFGCDPTDGLAPVVARTRAWTGDGDASLTITASAYTAGAGAVALDDISSAALSCSSAWTEAPTTSPGVETTQVASTAVTALIWRRGDVLVTASVPNEGSGAPGIDDFATGLSRLDQDLDQALQGTCLDQDAGTEDASRSPYIDRRAFRGYRVADSVDLPSSPGPSAEDRLATGTFPRAVKPVAVPAPDKTTGITVDLPQVPSPLPTTGPTALPFPVAAPVVPSVPEAAATSATVEREVRDATGPGCGWEFTGQAPPVFDQQAAAQRYARAVGATQRHLTRSWQVWQRARMTYFEAYAHYKKDARAYRAYATEIASISAAWTVIETARERYYDDYEEWQDAVAARDDWRADRAEARSDYKAAQKTCRHRDPATGSTPDDPIATPTADPTAGPSTGPSTGSAAGPGGTDEDQSCPAVRPEILDQTAPTVPPVPTPDAEAQLPVRGR